MEQVGLQLRMGAPHEIPARHRRESLTVLLLACGFGVVFLARNALGYLSPFLVADLDLQNRSIGLLASAYSLAWAVSGFAITAVTRGFTRRALLTVLLFALGVASLASSFATTFLALFLARLASGIVSGPVMPLMQSYAAQLGSNAHRGLRMGVVQGLGSTVFGGVLAPLILVPIALHWGWRIAFLPVAAMAVASAVLLLRALPSTVADRAQRVIETKAAPKLPSSGFVHANILLCSLIGAAMVGWLVVSLTFYPLYLISVQNRSPAEMSALMSLMGVSSLIAAILVPHLSDRFGRRRVMIAFALLGVVGPLGVLVPHASLSLLAVSVFFGSFAGGTFPLFLAVIPAETVGARQLPTVIGLIQGISEIVGGVALPLVAGWAADRIGLQAPLLITLVGTLLAGLFALALRETDREGVA
jgi:ACS family hexuronate transporter-like MFS transporter